MVPTYLKFPKWLIVKENGDNNACIYTLQKQVWKANYTRQVFHRSFHVFYPS